MVIENGTVQKL